MREIMYCCIITLVRQNLYVLHSIKDRIAKNVHFLKKIGVVA